MPLQRSSLKKIKSDQILKAEPKRKQSTPRTSFQQGSSYEQNIKLPQISDVPKAAREGLFVRKLKLCSMVYNFMEAKEMKEKQLKFSTLKELVLFVQEEGNVATLTEPTYQEIVSMVSHNILRTFPQPDYTDYEPEYDESSQEAAWPHLKLVYDLILHFINSPEVNLGLLRKVINRSFISQIIELLNSEDSRERKCLKSLSLSIYLKLFEQRAFIRKCIRNVFLSYIYETGQFNGMAELLDILCMAINGYNVPLRQEHMDFLIKVLIPLHSPRYLSFYHKELLDCLKGYIKKDENTFESIMLGILRYWPKTCTEKELLFMQEVLELLAMVANNQFVKIQEPLIKQVAKCVSSLHYRVAEEALAMWDNQDFLRHFSVNSKILMPLVFPSVYRVSRVHWNSSISECAGQVLCTFSEVNKTLFNSLAEKAKKAKGRKVNR